MKNKRTFLGNLAYGTAVVFTILAGAYVTLSNSRTHLKPEDFKKAEWIKFDNENGRIWSCYTNENIPQHTANWNRYENEVREKNKGKLEGDILLPDLDGDGKVGK
jgi:hypothetical protein